MKFDIDYINNDILKVGCVFIDGDDNHKYLISSISNGIITTDLDTNISYYFTSIYCLKEKFNIIKIIDPENLKLVEIKPKEKSNIKLHNYEEDGKIYVLGSASDNEVFTCKFCNVEMERVTPHNEWTTYECKKCGRKHIVFDPEFSK